MSNTEETNKPSAGEYLEEFKRLAPNINILSRSGMGMFAESFASMRVEQAKEQWEQYIEVIRKNILISISENMPEEWPSLFDEKVRKIVNNSFKTFE